MTLIERLADAEAAYHNLLTGVSVVEITDQNGEKMRYTPINRGALATYIADLKRQINGGNANAPMSIWGRS